MIHAFLNIYMNTIKQILKIFLEILPSSNFKIVFKLAYTLVKMLPYFKREKNL